MKRRDFLKVGALGSGLTLSQYLALVDAGEVEEAAKARSAILVFLKGGPSHLDTFDLKPEAPSEYRGEFRPVGSNKSRRVDVRVVAAMNRDPDECLADGNRKWAYNAPLLLAALADTRFRERDRPNRWAQYDTGSASMSLALQAVALGLIAHQMGGFDGERLSASFGVPERYTPMAMIAVGYPGDPNELPENFQERELAERNRQPLGEIAFAGRWESPYLD